MNEVILLVISFAAGALGALVGIGGGIVIVPLLTIVFGFEIREAVAVSLVAVVGTSASASVSHLRSGLANVRLGTVLEFATVLGSLGGYALSRALDPGLISLVFGMVLLATALLSLRRRSSVDAAPCEHPWSRALGLGRSLGPLERPVREDRDAPSYPVVKLPLGLGLMVGAGALSALLGIGAGVFKVLALDGVMKVPLRSSSATSSLMMGTTASAGAFAYFMGGYLRLDVAAIVVIAIVIGARYGARLLVPLPVAITRTVFWIVLVVAAFRMIAKGLA